MMYMCTRAIDALVAMYTMLVSFSMLCINKVVVHCCCSVHLYISLSGLYLSTHTHLKENMNAVYCLEVDILVF